MEEAAKRKDRGGDSRSAESGERLEIEGPAADPEHEAFIAYMPAMPVRHGRRSVSWRVSSTLRERSVRRLRFVPAEHGAADLWYDQTGLVWINPSPNMRNSTRRTVYPGIGDHRILQVSVGGEDQPFEQLGAPWIAGAGWRRRSTSGAAGIRFYR